MEKATRTDLAILLGLFLLLGLLFVPAHLVSLWADPEFTGWVAPLANRIGNPLRLYADGLHSPMAPLPFVVLRVFTGGRAIWFDESLANFICQSLTLVACYFILRRCFAGSRSVALAATLVTAAIFFSLSKSVLYDSLVQLLVAVECLLVLAVARLHRTGDLLKALAALGAVAALAVLAKQSTGGAAFVGSAVAILLLGPTWRAAMAHVGVYVLSFVATLAIVLLVSTPLLSPAGFVTDVILTGGEPKGGPMALALNAITFTYQLVRNFGAALVVSAASIAFLYLVRRRFPATQLKARADDIWTSIFLALLSFAIIGLVRGIFFGEPSPLRLSFRTMNALGYYVGIGLFVWAIVSSWHRPRSWQAQIVALRSPPLLACLVLLPAALGHNLSVVVLRLGYDNNPVIALAAGAYVQAVLHFFGPGSRLRWPSWLPATAVAGLCAAAWVTFAGPNILRALACTDDWTEIPYLAHARLRPDAAGMRTLVRIVDRLAQPGEAVLLLPRDPNVEEWFDRPPPILSTAIIFSDQYWHRYVDADLRKLDEAPPRVIVVGPRETWRSFHSVWSHATIDLIDRIQSELIDKRYVLHASVPISYNEKPDFMDVYLRN